MTNQLMGKEHKKIKQYIVNPIEIGLWETTFTIMTLKSNSLILYINDLFHQPQSTYINSPPTINIGIILSTMCNIVNTNYQNYNIPNEYKNSIKEEFIEKHNIKMIQNHLTIDEEFFFISQNNHNYIKVLSLHKTLSKNLEKIFKKLEYGILEKREKRFSPKSILFQPYFYYTQIMSNTLFSSTKEEQNYFERAIMSYNNGQLNQSNSHHQYEESIRMIGKAFESTLTHIYETLLRKDASHLSSIGKLLNSIENEVKNILENTSQQKKHNLQSISKEIYKKCKNFERTNEQNPQTIINKFKEIAKIIENQLRSTDNVLFPNQIQRELENVLILRNQVSHHNTTQSTQENVISMLFSYIQIYLWWQEASQSIQNWDGTKKEIIEEFEALKKENRIIKFNSFLEKSYIAPPFLWIF